MMDICASEWCVEANVIKNYVFMKSALLKHLLKFDI